MQSTRHQDNVYLLKAISYWYVHHFEEENENEMISSFFSPYIRNSLKQIA